METMAAGRVSFPVSSRRNAERAFQAHRASLGRSLRRCPECRPQDLGEREDEMPVGDGSDYLLPDELSPQGGALGGTGRAKTSLFTGKGDKIFTSASVAPDARESALGKATV
jgi:hypothetical protein